MLLDLYFFSILFVVGYLAATWKTWTQGEPTINVVWYTFSLILIAPLSIGLLIGEMRNDIKKN